jgi:hypothetical protein
MLERAAVIGRDFTFSLLEAVVDGDARYAYHGAQALRHVAPAATSSLRLLSFQRIVQSFLDGHCSTRYERRGVGRFTNLRNAGASNPFGLQLHRWI